MDHRSAYLFNTLSTPHGAAVLPGEDVAEACYLALEAGEAAVADGDLAALSGAVSVARPDLPEGVTPALREAISAMVAVIDDAAGEPEAVCGQRAEEWSAAARDARRRVVRMSLELRLVVSVESVGGAPA
jgi:hypothetical protein